MRHLYIFLTIAFVLFLGILFFNSFSYTSKQFWKGSNEQLVSFPDAPLHLSKAVHFPTISVENRNDTSYYSTFIAFHHYLEQAFPRIHSKLTKKKINQYSLLYKWAGKNENLPPVILMAHQDVVPIPPQERKNWIHPPYSGIIVQDTIWGRGTLDDKIGLISILEATEELLAQGFTPERSIYFAFGHDEEIGGYEGAQKISEYLEQKNVKAQFVLDEGLTITQGLVPKIELPVALIGIAEKGTMSIELSVELEGGHSSMPGKHTAIDVLAKNVYLLKEKELPAKFTKPVDLFLDYIGPEMPYPEQLIFSNRWLFNPLILYIYKQSNAGNALIRTTTAPTIFKSGVKDNVLPRRARATINFRLLPNISKQDLLKHLYSVLDTSQVKIKLIDYSKASPLSPTKSGSFQYLCKTIASVYPSTLIAPSLLIAGTDSKHFGKITTNIYKFLPIHLTPNNISQIHGVNERIAVRDLNQSVNFYYQLMKNLEQIE